MPVLVTLAPRALMEIILSAYGSQLKIVQHYVALVHLYRSQCHGMPNSGPQQTVDRLVPAECCCLYN